MWLLKREDLQRVMGVRRVVVRLLTTSILSMSSFDLTRRTVLRKVYRDGERRMRLRLQCVLLEGFSQPFQANIIYLPIGCEACLEAVLEKSHVLLVTIGVSTLHQA